MKRGMAVVSFSRPDRFRTKSMRFLRLAINRGTFPLRIRLESSPSVTSRRQCKPFSTTWRHPGQSVAR